MNTSSRHALRFVFYAFSLLALVYCHMYIVVREGETFVWLRLLPAVEVLSVIFGSLEALAGLGLIGAGFRAWCTLQEAWGKASPFAREIHHEGIAQVVARRWNFPRLPYIAKLAMGGAVIFACALALLASGKLDSAEGSTFPLPYPGPDSNAVSMVLTFSTPDDNLADYLAGVRKIAIDLERAGAKVIVCAVPDTSIPVNRMSIIDSIGRMKSVVMYDGRLDGIPRHWSFPAGDQDRERMPFVTTVVHEDMTGGGDLYQWYPCASYNPTTYPTKERETRIDVAVVAVGRFLGLDAGVRPVPGGAGLMFGNIQIPVTASGMAYSRAFHAVPSDLIAIATRREKGGTAVDYRHYPEWEQSGDIPAAYVSQFAGKIVLIDWVHYEPFGYTFRGFFAPARTMQSNIESIVRGSSLVSMDWLTVVLIAAIIAMSLLMTMRIRLSWSVIMTLTAGMAVFVAGIVVYHNSPLLLRTGYALTSAIMCAVIFPYIRLVHERAQHTEAS